ncbi:hypothetical protein IFM89_036319 [Coptis chinensis]|uniref:Pentatricopeptide repeat-containing protein n=1 Tax=Coptis chinensis TaxID=261450 RepID=A0A835IKM9_9MAGN|nr:hypothetical protein IFM89_036319 [Coptis chinensis]
MVRLREDAQCKKDAQCYCCDMQGGTNGGGDGPGKAQNDVEDENPDIILEENGQSNKWVGSVVVKQKVFEETPERTNEKVVKVVSVLRNASLAVNGFLESSLGKLELTVNEEFMVRVIETPLVPGESLIRFFKWAWKKTEFSMTAQVVDCLIKVIGNGQRKIEIYSLWDLVKKIGKEEKSLLSSESLNHLISLFWRSGKGKAGLEVFNKFEEFGCEPNANSYYFTIEALYRRSIFDKAWVVCEKMLTAGKLPG